MLATFFIGLREGLEVRTTVQTYLTRDTVRQDGFDYIETFYNPTRRHTNNGMLSPVD